jgi:hypothetical protein
VTAAPLIAIPGTENSPRGCPSQTASQRPENALSFFQFRANERCVDVCLLFVFRAFAENRIPLLWSRIAALFGRLSKPPIPSFQRVADHPELLSARAVGIAASHERGLS